MALRALAVLVPLLLGALAAPLGAGAQQAGRIPHIGYLSAGSPGPNPLLDAFRQGLRELGYVEGQNIMIEYRYADGKNDRLPALAVELARRNVSVIVTSGAPAVLAARSAAGTIPVVMAAVGDPIGIGVVASLARPGGNVTGLSLVDTELDGKRLELLKEIVPRLSRVGALWSANDPGMTLAFGRVQRAAQVLGLHLLDVGIGDPGEFHGAFQAAVRGGAEAIIVTAQAFTLRHRDQVVGLAAKNRLPAMYTLRAFVDVGGLMAYGPRIPDMFRRAAYYVDRILKGAKPADLPVEQPTKFELVINLQAAKALGLAIPNTLLLRADQVIE